MIKDKRARALDIVVAATIQGIVFADEHGLARAWELDCRQLVLIVFFVSGLEGLKGGIAGQRLDGRSNIRKL
jgi:hypothetical protein